MSQFFVESTGSSPLPPTVATSYVTDVNSPSVPIANVENVFGGQTSANNNNGIRTDGSSGSNTITVQLTNLLTGQVTTNDTTPTTIITFPLSATPGTYSISGSVAAFDATDTAGGTFSFSIGLRSTGAAITFLGTTVDSVFLEAAVSTIDIAVSSSGNSFLLKVVGVAGKTIDWNAGYTYRFVS